MSEYEKQAEEFLKSHGIEFSFVRVGNDCPKYCEDPLDNGRPVTQFPRRDHIHGAHYRCTLTRETRGGQRVVTFDYWNSYADEEFYELGTRAHRLHESFAKYGKATKSERERYLVPGSFAKLRKPGPTAYDLLACLQKYPVGSFTQFCGEFGYSPDSIKAHETWEAVGEEYAKVSSFFMGGELEDLQEIN